jgi:hypothetical protein
LHVTVAEHGRQERSERGKGNGEHDESDEI